MARRSAVSMQDIADKLGVSKVTVSKALNGKDGVSEAVREKILETAHRYGYQLPDYGQRKSRKVAIIMSDRFHTGDAGKFYMSMYEVIIQELRKLYCSSMMITPNRNSLRRDMETIRSSGLFDGLILLGILDKEVLREMEELELPKVYVDVYDGRHRWDSVVTENIYSSYEMTHYLIEQGHREIGFVGSVGVTTSITDRYLGFARAMLEKGLCLRAEWRISDRDEEGEAVELELPEKLPTAFVCNCDETAFRLVRLLKEKDISVPEQVSVAGFDNDIYAELCEPGLTTVAVNISEIGKTAAKRMVKVMEDQEKAKGEVFRIPGSLICRESVKKAEKKLGTK